MKKINKIKVFRLIVQVLSFALLPYLFSLTFSELKQVYKILVIDKANLITILPQFVETFVIIGVTVLLGRFFCGWLCAFGSVNDFLYALAGKLIKKRLRLHPMVDMALKSLKFIILIFIIAAIWTKGNSIYNAYNPWDAFAGLLDFPQVFYDYTIGIIVLSFIFIGAMLVERFFCRYLCPLGAIFVPISALRILRIGKPTDKCGSCRECTKACSMGILMYKTNKVNSCECINCYKCVDACPRANANAAIGGLKLDPVLAGSFAVSAFVGIYSASGLELPTSQVATKAAVSSAITPTPGLMLADRSSESPALITPSNQITITPSQASERANTHKPPVAVAAEPNDKKTSTIALPIQGNNTAAQSVAIPSTVPKIAPTDKPITNIAIPVPKNNKYKDGTYIGTGRGYRPGLQVSVTVKNDRILSVQILSDNETPAYANRPFSVVPQSIISSQSVKVNAVSGATRTSEGIKQAVADALSKAMV